MTASLSVSALAAAGLLGAALYLTPFSGRAPRPEPRAQQSDPLLGPRTKGADDAPVVVFEMSDFQCPWCRQQAVEVLPEIERDFIATGKVRWTFINFPLTSLHPNAAAAAEFAMCAARSGKFWPVHDLLFTHQARWAPLKDPGPFLLTLADSVGLPRVEVLACLRNHETQSLIKAEAEGAARSGVESTPTLYIVGAGLIPGAQPYRVYAKILHSLWKERTGK